MGVVDSCGYFGITAGKQAVGLVVAVGGGDAIDCHAGAVGVLAGIGIGTRQTGAGSILLSEAVTVRCWWWDVRTK